MRKVICGIVDPPDLRSKASVGIIDLGLLELDLWSGDDELCKRYIGEMVKIGENVKRI